MISLASLLAVLPTMAFAAGPSKTSGPTSSAVTSDMLSWFGSHPGVSYALAIGVVAFAAGIVLNRGE
jgi:hypothetical protein